MAGAEEAVYTQLGAGGPKLMGVSHVYMYVYDMCICIYIYTYINVYGIYTYINVYIYMYIYILMAYTPSYPSTNLDDPSK